METKKLTAAESTLAAMSKTVLVLGIIGSVFAFFSSCIAWEYSKYSGGIVGVDGINWLGFPVLIYCIMGTLIGWAVLSILVEISVIDCIRGRSGITHQTGTETISHFCLQ